MNNADICRTLTQAIERQEWPKAREVLAQDAVIVMEDQPMRIDAWMAMLQELATAFPDMELQAEDFYQVDQQVTVPIRFKGTQKGTLDLSEYGLPVVPGKQTLVELAKQTCSFQLDHGKIIEVDLKPASGAGAQGLYQQLGVRLQSKRSATLEERA
jgi:predicted ester cyclase